MSAAWTLASTLLAQTADPSKRAIGDVTYYLALTLVGGGLVLLLLTLWSMWKTRWRDPRRARAAAALSGTSIAAPPIDAPVLPAPTVPEAQRLFQLMNDADDLSTRASAQIEEKLSRLQDLIAAAEAASSTLARHLAEVESQTASMSAMRFANADAPRSPPVFTPPQPQAQQLPVVTIPRETAHRSNPLTAGVVAASVHRPTASTTPVHTGAEHSGPDPLTSEIYRLADQGLSHVEVARKLNQHVGKVELILALRP